MSRVAKKPINLPKGVEVSVAASNLSVKGSKGTLSLAMPANVEIKNDNGIITMMPATDDDMAMAGTIRAILSNMIVGVSEGFTRKLELVASVTALP